MILAAGAGSRFAGPDHKLRTLVRGRPVVAWVIDSALAAGLDEVIVVTGSADLDDLVPEGIRVVRNPDWASGQASSLQVAVRAAAEAGHQAIVVGLADQPFVPIGAWQAVAAVDAPIAVAEFDGQVQPPIKLRHDVWSLLPTHGDEGARSLLRSRSELVVRVPCQGESADLDTLEDLTRWN